MDGELSYSICEAISLKRDICIKNKYQRQHKSTVGTAVSIFQSITFIVIPMNVGAAIAADRQYRARTTATRFQPRTKQLVPFNRIKLQLNCYNSSWE